MTDSGRDFVPVSDEIGHPLTNERSCCPVGWREEVREEGGKKRERERGGEVEVMNISIGGIEKKVRHGVAQLAEQSPSRGFESTQVSFFPFDYLTCS